MTIDDCLILLRVLMTPSASISSTVSLKPAVSIKRNEKPPRVITSSMVSLVVPGMGDTIALSSSKSTFSSVDFPALGFPAMVTGMPFLMAFPASKEADNFFASVMISITSCFRALRSANSTSSSLKSSSSSISAAN